MNSWPKLLARLSPISFYLFSVALSTGALCLIFPDLLIFQRVSYAFAHDFGVNYQANLTLISDFFHGGIQLWNRFDQVNIAYQALSAGLYTLLNLTTSLAYCALSPFLKTEGTSFHAIYTSVFFVGSIFIRTFGGYLLLSQLCQSRLAILVGLLYLNTVLSLPLYFGLMTNNLYSYLPLICYGALRLTEMPGIKNFCLMTLFSALIVANSPLMALGYFYQGIHFFLIAVFIHRVLIEQKPFRLNHEEWNRGAVRKIAFVFLIAGLIVFPYLGLYSSLRDDFELASGSDRLSNALSLSAYFAKGWAQVPLREIFINSLAFTKNDWPNSGIFLGVSTIFLSLLALFFAPDRRKYIFFLTLFLLLSLDSPRWGGNFFSGLAHGINALTNPFKFLTRTFHMTLLAMPLFLCPLVAMGVDVLVDRKGALNQNRLRIFYGLFVTVCLVAGCAVDFQTRIYLVSAVLLSTGLLFFISRENRAIALSFGISLLILDAVTVNAYIQQDPLRDQIGLHPVLPHEPESNVLMDYQNPTLLPFRQHLNTFAAPDIREQPLNANGIRFVNFARFFKPLFIYFPRHKNYRDLIGDPATQAYLTQHDLNVRGVPFLKDSTEPDLESVGNAKTEFTERSWALTEGKSMPGTAFTELWFDLPDDFPGFLSSSVVTKDIKYLEVSAAQKKFAPTQGPLSRIFQFDVQNIKRGKLVVSVPASWPPDTKVALRYATRFESGISTVWKNQQDNLGFEWEGTKGWLVFHSPYDKKWQLSVDGVKTPIQRVGKYFFGTPIQGGHHQVLLSYWPDTWLRMQIFVSILLSLGVAGYLASKFWIESKLR